MSSDPLVQAFFEEATELLADFEAGLLQLEDRPNDAELLSHSVLRLSLFQSTRLDLAASLRTVGEAIDLSREVGEAYDHLGGYSIRCGVLRFLGDVGLSVPAGEAPACRRSRPR